MKIYFDVEKSEVIFSDRNESLTVPLLKGRGDNDDMYTNDLSAVDHVKVIKFIVKSFIF